MAEANWTFMTGSVGTGVTRRGVTSGTVKPNGGGTYVFGFNTVSATAGSVALYTSQGAFVPNGSGGVITAAICRGPSASPTQYSNYLFIGAQGTGLSDNAYMLGLSDNNPSSLVLRKGTIASGIVDGEEGDAGIIRKSADTFTEGTWLHVRLDMIVNPSGDVILKVWQSDLNANAVTSPVWVGVDGMDDFVDDALGINSLSPPYTSGYMGFGFQHAALSRRAFVDHMTCARQTV